MRVLDSASRLSICYGVPSRRHVPAAVHSVLIEILSVGLAGYRMFWLE